MRELKFDSVGIGEEEGVLALAELRILGWSVEDDDSRVEEEAMESIEVGAVNRFEGDVRQTPRESC